MGCRQYRVSALGVKTGVIEGSLGKDGLTELSVELNKYTFEGSWEVTCGCATFSICTCIYSIGINAPEYLSGTPRVAGELFSIKLFLLLTLMLMLHHSSSLLHFATSNPRLADKLPTRIQQFLPF